MTLEEGQSTTRPPLLEGSNYASWKPKMKSFLKFLDEKAWKEVLIGWTQPGMESLMGEVVPKPETLWDEEDEKSSIGNSKAMNAIFSGVDENVVKLIINCEVAKEAWDILQTAYEGTDKVRNSRIQIVTTKFEDMKMKESETIPEYNVRVLDLSKEAAALGKPIDGDQMTSKVLRSLPPRLAMKVAIEEMHDISTLKLDELMGSLRTYEMNHEAQSREVKGISLKAEVSEGTLESYCTTEQLAMMGQNFGRMVPKINRRGLSKVSYPRVTSETGKPARQGPVKKGRMSLKKGKRSSATNAAASVTSMQNAQIPSRRKRQWWQVSATMNQMRRRKAMKPPTLWHLSQP
ncbi:unnamed protein product [Rhodiola kirilowii]